MNDRTRGLVQSFLLPLHSFQPSQLSASATNWSSGCTPSGFWHARWSLYSSGAEIARRSLSAIVMESGSFPGEAAALPGIGISIGPPKVRLAERTGKEVCCLRGHCTGAHEGAGDVRP